MKKLLILMILCTVSLYGCGQKENVTSPAEIETIEETAKDNEEISEEVSEEVSEEPIEKSDEEPIVAEKEDISLIEAEEETDVFKINPKKVTVSYGLDLLGTPVTKEMIPDAYFENQNDCNLFRISEEDGDSYELSFMTFANNNVIWSLNASMISDSEENALEYYETLLSESDDLADYWVEEVNGNTLACNEWQDDDNRYDITFITKAEGGYEVILEIYGNEDKLKQ